MFLKTIIDLLAPTLLRAFTFFLDRRWGTLITSFVSGFIPSPTSIMGLLVITTIMTLIVVFAERLLKGQITLDDVFGRRSQEHPSDMDPHQGVSA